MTDLTPERRAELRQLLDDHATDPGEWCCDTLPQAAMDALLALLDAADLLDEVRDQVRRGALCPMCSTGMARQTVGMICQLCGANYGEESTR